MGSSVCLIFFSHIFALNGLPMQPQKDFCLLPGKTGELLLVCQLCDIECVKAAQNLSDIIAVSYSMSAISNKPVWDTSSNWLD